MSFSSHDWVTIPSNTEEQTAPTGLHYAERSLLPHIIIQNRKLLNKLGITDGTYLQAKLLLISSEKFKFSTATAQNGSPHRVGLHSRHDAAGCKAAPAPGGGR